MGSIVTTGVLVRIAFERPDHGDERQNIEPPLATLVLGDERLRPACIGLGQAGRPVDTDGSWRMAAS